MKRKVDHVVLAPSPTHFHLRCRYCGAEFREPLPLEIEITTKLTKTFLEAHKGCHRPHTLPEELQEGMRVRLYSIMNPRRNPLGEGKIRSVGHMNESSPAMVWIEGFRGCYHPGAIEVLQEEPNVTGQ